MTPSQNRSCPSTISPISIPMNTHIEDHVEHSSAKDNVEYVLHKSTSRKAFGFAPLHTLEPVQFSISQCYFARRRSAPTSYTSTRASTSNDFIVDHMCVADERVSPYSDGSNDYLTPPSIEHESDIPPFKPTRQDSSSLTMSSRKNINVKSKYETSCARNARRHALSKSCGGDRVEKHKSWLYGHSQIVPTTSGECRQSARGYRNCDETSTVRASSSDSWQSIDTVIQNLNRRWSSIEFRSPKALQKAARTFASGDKVDSGGLCLETSFPSLCDQTSTKNANIIRTIRQILTTTPVHALQVPELITLKRASGRGTSLNLDTCQQNSDLPKTDTTPLISRSVIEDRAYLVTQKDVEVITSLVQANLHAEPSREMAADPSVDHKSFSQRLPRLTSKGLVVSAGSVLESALTPTDVELYCGKQLGSSHTTLQPTSNPNPSPQKSIHEVIWENESTSQCVMSPSSRTILSPGDLPRLDAIHKDDLPGCSNSSPAIQVTRSEKEMSTLDPGRQRRAISRSADNIKYFILSSEFDSSEHIWSKKQPLKHQLERRIEATDSSEQNDRTSRTSNRPSLHRSRTDSIQDVLSFPPLPARSSNDWHVPLPSFDSPALTSSRSLYELGLDVNPGPGLKAIEAADSVSTHPFFTSWVRTAETSAKGSRAPSTAFDPCYEIGRKSRTASPPRGDEVVKNSLTIDGCYSQKSSRACTIDSELRRVHTLDGLQKSKLETAGPRARSLALSTTSCLTEHQSTPSIDVTTPRSSISREHRSANADLVTSFLRLSPPSPGSYLTEDDMLMQGPMNC